MKIFHNPRCSKSRQGLAILEESGQKFEIVEYLKNSPSKVELKEVIQLLGIPAVKLIRRGEADFKENFKGKELTEDQWIDAMIQYPKLIERPIVVNGDKAVIGRPPENISDIL